MKLDFNYLVHEGGTKYYLVVSGGDGDQKQFCLNIWGKMDANKNPQTCAGKDSFSANSQQNRFMVKNKIDQKLKRGYFRDTSSLRASLGLTFQFDSQEEILDHCMEYGFGSIIYSRIKDAALNANIQLTHSIISSEEFLGNKTELPHAKPAAPTPSIESQYESYGDWG